MPVKSKAQFRLFQWLLHKAGTTKKDKSLAKEMLKGSKFKELPDRKKGEVMSDAYEELKTLDYGKYRFAIERAGALLCNLRDAPHPKDAAKIEKSIVGIVLEMVKENHANAANYKGF